MKATTVRIRLILLAVSAGLAGFVAVGGWRLANRPPEHVALAFARAVYARDYARAWMFISSADKEFKTPSDYLAENESFTGLEQELAYILAGWIQFTDISVQVDGSQATVTTRVNAPNGNQAEVYEMLRAANRESDLTAAERQALFDRLQAMYATGEIEILEGEQTFILSREWTGWRIVLDWAGAIVVRLTAEVSPDLQWEFYPLQSEVRVLPGETVRATYRVTNLSDQEITGKAKHFILPEGYEDYFTSIQCFCFIQQTLQPGESEDMTLIFRIDYDVPAEVRELENRYVFYPLESFPDD